YDVARKLERELLLQFTQAQYIQARVESEKFDYVFVTFAENVAKSLKAPNSGSRLAVKNGHVTDAAALDQKHVEMTRLKKLLADETDLARQQAIAKRMTHLQGDITRAERAGSKPARGARLASSSKVGGKFA